MRDEPSVDFRLKTVLRAPTDLLRHHVDGHVISDVMPGVTANGDGHLSGRQLSQLAERETTWYSFKFT